MWEAETRARLCFTNFFMWVSKEQEQISRKLMLLCSTNAALWLTQTDTDNIKRSNPQSSTQDNTSQLDQSSFPLLVTKNNLIACNRKTNRSGQLRATTLCLQAVAQGLKRRCQWSEKQNSLEWQLTGLMHVKNILTEQSIHLSKFNYTAAVATTATITMAGILDYKTWRP